VYEAKVFFNLLALNRDSHSIKDMILPSMLWIMLWAGYNTGIERLLDSDFPTNTLDLFHVSVHCYNFVRIYSGCILLKNGHLGWLIRGPIGLLMLYAFIGLFRPFFFQGKRSYLYTG